MTQPAAVYVGIDPGLRGGMVALTKRGSPVATSGPWPDLHSAAIDIISALRKLDSLNYQPFVAIERVGANPKWSRKACFTFGSFHGMLIGTMLALPFVGRFELVTPASWQSVIRPFPGKDSKARAKAAVESIFKSWEKVRNSHDGIIDAAMIAEWLRRREHRE